MECFGHNPGSEIEGVYLWTASPSGNVVALCAPCTIAWRTDVAAGTCEPPTQVTSLRAS